MRARAQLLTENTHVQIIGCTPQGPKQIGTIPKIWILKGTIFTTLTWSLEYNFAFEYSFCETAFGSSRVLWKRQTKVSQFEHFITKHIYKVKGSKSWTAWHTNNQQATRNVSQKVVYRIEKFVN